MATTTRHCYFCGHASAIVQRFVDRHHYAVCTVCQRRPTEELRNIIQGHPVCPRGRKKKDPFERKQPK